MTNRQLNAVAEAIREHLPSFSVGIFNPDDISNAKYAQSIAEVAAQAAIDASDAQYVPMLVKMLKAIHDYQGRLSTGNTGLKGTTYYMAEKALNQLPEDLRE